MVSFHALLFRTVWLNFLICKMGRISLKIPQVSVGLDEVNRGVLEGTGRNFTSKFCTQNLAPQGAERRCYVALISPHSLALS